MRRSRNASKWVKLYIRPCLDDFLWREGQSWREEVFLHTLGWN